MYFQYDTSGTPLGFIYNGVQYFYITNQMNDVLAITDTSGTIVGNYEYDAWGTVTLADTEIAQQNPLRYRGYYYDNETGYYYLQSRYYDSEICRFINSDIAEISQMSKDIPVGTNLFAYCNNDPVNNRDLDGHIAANVISGIVGGLISALVEIVTQAIIHYFKYHSMNRFRISTRNLIISAIQGVASGVLLSTKYKRIVQAVGSGIIAAFGTVVRNYKSTNLVNLVKSALSDFAFSAMIGLLCGNGVGSSFWKKDFKSVLGKGQYVYKNVRLTSGQNGILITSSLKLTKPVVREFAGAFAKFIAGAIASSIRSIRKAI